MAASKSLPLIWSCEVRGLTLVGQKLDTAPTSSLVRAREAAADALPVPTTDHQRVVFSRIQSLAAKDSEHVSASLCFANAQVAALAAQSEA